MASKQILHDDPLGFIKQCVEEKRVFWTYHVNMRLKERSLSCKMILEAVESYEIIESYPEDKYMPSYLVFAQYENTVFHILFATDVENTNVRIVTAYLPNREKWNFDLKRRKKS